jgi:hypothetical protein
MKKIIPKNTFLMFTWISMLILSSILLPTQVSTLSFDNSPSKSITDEIKPFSINSSEKIELFTFGFSSFGIGTTYQVSISTDDNSTSNIIITYSTNPPDQRKWEGPNDFLIITGEAVEYNYISHVCGDLIDRYTPTFFAELTNPSGFVTGFHSFSRIEDGYFPNICGTGHLIVDDINLWLLSKFIIENFLFLVFFVIIGIGSMTYLILRRKKRA